MTKQLDDLFAEMDGNLNYVKEKLKSAIDTERKKTITEFNEKAKVLNATKEKNEQELQAMGSRYKKLKTKNQKCERKCKKLEEECYKLKTVLEGNVTKKQQQKQLEALRATLTAKHHEEITRLKAEMKEIQDKADENIKRLNDKLEAEKKENENDEKNLEKALQDAKKQHALDLKAAVANEKADAAQRAKAVSSNQADTSEGTSEKNGDDGEIGNLLEIEDGSDFDDEDMYSNINLRY